VPIGLFRMKDEGQIDDKVLCVPAEDPNWSWIKGLDMLPEQLRDEISHFFSVYKQPEGKHVDVDGWYPKEAALEVIEESLQRQRDLDAQD
jgi:inorganic pyrophosphatase